MDQSKKSNNRTTKYNNDNVFYDEKIRNFLFITILNCFVLQCMHNHKDGIINIIFN